MQRLLSRYKDKTALNDGGDIAALHGIRAVLVGIVGAFHIWQQSWLTPRFALFGQTINLDTLLRSGYMWVDGLLLLSAFLCYLPYARAREAARPSPAVLPFYQNRLARVVPTYLLNLLVMLLVVALPRGLYPNPWAAGWDMLAHITFTHTLFPFSYWGTPLNGALWTLGVEMQFYLLFPLLARAFRKMPLLTYVGMAGSALLFRVWAAAQGDTAMYFNQLPAFLDVYANGFVAASVYISLRKRMKEDSWTRILMTVCAIAALAVLASLAQGQAWEVGVARVRLGQMARRYAQSVFTALMMLGFALGLGGFRLLLGNRVTRFLSAISLQFYMWHQVIALQLRHWGIPHSALPNPAQAGDKIWQRQYVLLCVLLALGVATAMTYLVEQPLARRLRAGKKNRSV